jgi:DNA-binding CsgD family transcriptional regulator
VSERELARFRTRYRALSVRQRADLGAVCARTSRREAALALGLNEYTLRSRLNRIYRALGHAPRSHRTCYLVGVMVGAAGDAG